VSPSEYQQGYPTIRATIGRIAIIMVGGLSHRGESMTTQRLHVNHGPHLLAQRGRTCQVTAMRQLAVRSMVAVLCLLAWGDNCRLAAEIPGPLAPDASRQSMRLRDGFTVELMAAEPLVMDPIAIDWGSDGRLWVVEMADYPTGSDGS